MHRLDQISLKQLRALESVVAEGSIAAAAERLNLTAPAVHNQLKLLEETIGSPLVLRGGQDRNRPTPQGEALIAAYAETCAALERAMHQIAAIDRGQRGSVVLGVVSTAKYFAPGIVARLESALPEIEVVLRVGNRESIVAALARRELDLCIMGRPPREPMVEAVSLGDHPHVLIAAADHPLATGRAPETEELLAQRFVMREPGSGTRALAIRFLDEIGLGREVRMIEMSSNETIKQAVMSCLGIAVISAHTVAEELRAGRLVALRYPGFPILRSWFLLSHAEMTLTPAAEQVRNWITGHKAEILPRIAL